MPLFTSLSNIIRTVSNKLRDDYVNVFAAQAAFYVVICSFPFAMFFFNLLQHLMVYLPLSQEEILGICMQVFPHTLETFISSLLTELYSNSSGAILSVTAITTLWSAARSFLAITRGLEKIYNTPTKRNYIIKRLFSTIYTLIFALTLILLLVVFVFGNTLSTWIMERLPFLADFALLIISVRTLVGLAFLTVFFLLIYIVIPNRRTNLFRELPGALLSAAGWMGFSFLYSFYIDNMSNFSATYGSLTAVVLCMLWLYACMYIMFIGAELNALLASPAFRASLVSFFSRVFHKHGHKKRSHSVPDNSSASEDSRPGQTP